MAASFYGRIELYSTSLPARGTFLTRRGAGPESVRARPLASQGCGGARRPPGAQPRSRVLGAACRGCFPRPRMGPDAETRPVRTSYPAEGPQGSAVSSGEEGSLLRPRCSVTQPAVGPASHCRPHLPVPSTVPRTSSQPKAGSKGSRSVPSWTHACGSFVPLGLCGVFLPLKVPGKSETTCWPGAGSQPGTLEVVRQMTSVTGVPLAGELAWPAAHAASGGR